jgi:transposase
MTTNTHAKELNESLIARIDALLDAANQKRRQRLIGRTDALAVLRRVLDGEAWSFRHGGRVANAYTQSATTTFVLAARVGNSVFLGISTASAKGDPTPGRAWSQLQPWRYEQGPAGDAAAKWASWTGATGVIELTAGEIDAFLETEVSL